MVKNKAKQIKSSQHCAYKFGAWAWMLLSLVLVQSQAESAALDCARARTISENIICADDGLAKTDEALSELYSSLLKYSFNPVLLKQEQVYWLKNKRDKCSNADCIRLAYRKRQDQLQRWRRYTDVWAGSFAHIAFYDDAPPTDLLTDKTIGAKTREVVGNKFALLEAYLSTSSGSKIGNDQNLVVDGCAPHACGVAEARLMVSKLGQIYVAILDADRIFYFTNDLSRTDLPPESITDFISRRSNLKVYFMSRQ